MPRGRKKQILDHLAPSEHQPVLRALLDAHPDLRNEAEQLATSQLTDVDREVVAGSVTDAYLDRAGSGTAGAGGGVDGRVALID